MHQPKGFSTGYQGCIGTADTARMSLTQLGVPPHAVHDAQREVYTLHLHHKTEPPERLIV